jgi:hypothetical protein
MTEHQFTREETRTKDFTNERFGRLVVTGFAGMIRRGRHWTCRCDCGNTSTVGTAQLLSGHTKSCGCLKDDLLVDRSRTHGVSGTAEYDAWFQMLKRCTDPSTKHYDRYGGRGITVCERWRSLENFLADMGKRPSPRHSIDRIDNNGNYEPSNCRWATMSVQKRNYSRNRFYSYSGKTLCLKDWSREMGIHMNTLRSRLDKMGWSFEQSITTPPLQ